MATSKNYSPYQQKIIKRYYDNADGIGYQQLAELTTEIYLAEGKKTDKLWAKVESALEKVQIPRTRIDHLLEKKDPKLLAEVVKELTARG